MSVVWFKRRMTMMRATVPGAYSSLQILFAALV
jgi:hypothetical protein